MEIRILDQTEQESIYADAYAMLAAADHEFVPPLSARNSSTQQDLTGSAANGSVALYFENLKSQRFAAAFEDGELIAFVSYRENYFCPQISPEDAPNIYLSTLVASPAARGKGITKALYSKLFSEYENSYVFTRTWSTNIAHIKILRYFGFETLTVLENDRGNGIDTIYFKKAIKN